MTARKIAIVLQTPRDQASSVLQTYEDLAAELGRRGHLVTIVTPQDFPSVRGLAGRLTPLVYPFVIGRWMKREGTACDLVVFHSYAGWRAASRTTRADATRVPTVVAFHAHPA